MAEPIQSVDRALAILDFIAERGSATLNGLAEELDVSRPTAFRMLATLQGRHYITHSPAEHLYRLGPVFSSLSRRWVDTTLAHEARALMAELSGLTRETINLAVIRNTTLYYELSMEATRALRVSSTEGSVAPYTSTALGKAVLSHIDQAAWRDRLGDEPYVPATSNSILTSEALAREIAITRERGYATDREESVLGVSCVAAAFLGPDGQPLGALSVEAPTSRTSAQIIERNGALIAEKARQLTMLLKGDGDE